MEGKQEAMEAGKGLVVAMEAAGEGAGGGRGESGVCGPVLLMGLEHLGQWGLWCVQPSPRLP